MRIRITMLVAAGTPAVALSAAASGAAPPAASSGGVSGY